MGKPPIVRGEGRYPQGNRQNKILGGRVTPRVNKKWWIFQGGGLPLGSSTVGQFFRGEGTYPLPGESEGEGFGPKFYLRGEGNSYAHPPLAHVCLWGNKRFVFGLCLVCVMKMHHLWGYKRSVFGLCLVCVSKMHHLWGYKRFVFGLCHENASFMRL